MALTTEERREATTVVMEWLREHHGEDAVNFWAWEMTPMPFGLPLDEQLAEGLEMAVTPNPDAIRREAADRRERAFEAGPK